MMELSKLYLLAEEENIEVDCFDLKKRDALSIMDDDETCYIAINPYKLHSSAEERTKLAHELGHCITGSFYNVHASVEHRQRHENRADKWATKLLIPVDELDAAVATGCREIWELAEYFGVTEQFMRKAVCYYIHGNVAEELYF